MIPSPNPRRVSCCLTGIAVGLVIAHVLCVGGQHLGYAVKGNQEARPETPSDAGPEVARRDSVRGFGP